MKRISLLILFSILVVAVNAQNRGNQSKTSNSIFDPNRVVYGGNVSGSFSSDKSGDYWAVGLSPQIGYRLTNNFTTGLGVSYHYSTDKYDRSYTDGKHKIRETENLVGLNWFSNYYIAGRFFLTAKPEIFYSWETLKVDGVKERDNRFISAMVVGAGVYLKPITISVNYDLLQDDSTPYGDSVFVSVGFLF